MAFTNKATAMAVMANDTTMAKICMGAPRRAVQVC
jgi:hypothetical protein